MDFARMQSDPAAFRASLKIPTGTGSAMLRDVAADFQLRDFAALDAGFVALAAGQTPKPYSRFWIERTKGASKDSDLAVQLLWLLGFARRPLEIQIGAGDQHQADELRKAAKDIARLNSWLSQLVEIQGTRLINRRTEAAAEVLTTDGAGSHGGRPHLVVLNELSHLPGAVGKEFAETLLDNASKMPDGLVVICTNAGHENTWQAEWRANAQQSDRWYFSAYDRPAPWLDPQELAEAEKRNSTNRFLRLWRGVWVGESCTALSGDEIDRAVVLPGPIDGPELGWAYCAGCDLGLTRDFSAAVLIGRHVGHVERIEEPEPVLSTTLRALVELGHVAPPRRKVETRVHPGTGEIRLCRVEVWKPAGGRVELSDVQAVLQKWHQTFGLQRVLCDFWQAAFLAEQLRKFRVPAETITLTGNVLVEMAQCTLDAFRENLLRLYPDEGLLQDVRTLKAIEKGYGTKLECARSKEGGHGDRGTALQLALLAAKGLRMASQGIAGRKLVLWPPADYYD